LVRVQRNARVGIQVDANKGAESVIAICCKPQHHAMRLGQRKLTVCSLVRCQIEKITLARSIEVVLHCVDLNARVALKTDRSVSKARSKMPKGIPEIASRPQVARSKKQEAKCKSKCE